MKTTDMLRALKLAYALENLADLTGRAAREAWPHQDYLDRLLEGECQRREAGGIARRTKEARFPLRKDLAGFNWSWPKKINRAQIQNLFRLAFLEDHTNVVFIGGVGMGQTHLPIDKLGADLLFQVFSQRYEKGSTVITTNKTYKHWPEIFNNDATLTSAVLDRVLHHAETVLIEGSSYRMKDRVTDV